MSHYLADTFHYPCRSNCRGPSRSIERCRLHTHRSCGFSRFCRGRRYRLYFSTDFRLSHRHDYRNIHHRQNMPQRKACFQAAFNRMSCGTCACFRHWNGLQLPYNSSLSQRRKRRNCNLLLPAPLALGYNTVRFFCIYRKKNINTKRVLELTDTLNLLFFRQFRYLFCIKFLYCNSISGCYTASRLGAVRIFFAFL